MGAEARRAAGLDAFIQATSQRAISYPLSLEGTRAFLLEFARRTAGIDLSSLSRPRRFLRQLVAMPPEVWGVEGFRASLIDDTNPARHYAAFVFVGYWLPDPLGYLALWLWELAGMVRYGYWSIPDLRLGYIGLWHGRLVRRHGHTVLPALMARDLSENIWGRLSASGQRAVARARYRDGRPWVRDADEVDREVSHEDHPGSGPV